MTISIPFLWRGQCITDVVEPIDHTYDLVMSEMLRPMFILENT